MFNTHFTPKQIDRIRQHVKNNQTKRSDMKKQLGVCLAVVAVFGFTLWSFQQKSGSCNLITNAVAESYQQYEVLCENDEGELHRYAYVSTKQESEAYEKDFCDSMWLLDKLDAIKSKNKEVKK